MTTALALASSKTNWSAIVPARAPPPPPPVTQATMLKRTHEIQCGKCAISDYAENIGVWNDDGTLQELGLCGECEEQYPICEICADECVEYGDKLCHGCYHNSEGAEECWCASAVDDCLTDRARDALKRFAEKEEEATTEFARNKICDECGCKGGCELTCVYVCGEPCEICGATSDITDDWHGNSVCDECFMCCEECYNTKNPAVFEKTASDLCECEDKVQCEHCEGAVSDEGGIIVVMGQEMTICESCDMGGDCYDGFLDEYHYNAETNDYEEKEASQQAPKCLTDGCECEAAKNQYYPNSSWGEFWTLCEKCYEEDQEEDEPIPYCYENGKYSAPIPCGCPIPCRVSSSDDESEEEEEIVGKCQCCECDVTTDQDYLKLKTGPGAGRIYCEEHVGWGECQKAWSASCGCDVCADEEEQDE